MLIAKKRMLGYQGDAINMTDYARYASDILQARHRREALFPPALFDEFAWEILLALYISRGSGSDVDAATVFDTVGCRPAVGQRWLAYLAEKNQIVSAGPHIMLHDDAVGPMEEYLGGLIRDAERVT